MARRGSWFDKLTMISQGLSRSRGPSPDHPEPVEGDILSLPKGDKLTMIFFVLFVAWLLCVTSSGHGGCHPGICYFSLE